VTKKHERLDSQEEYGDMLGMTLFEAVPIYQALVALGLFFLFGRLLAEAV